MLSFNEFFEAKISSIFSNLGSKSNDDLIKLKQDLSYWNDEYNKGNTNVIRNLPKGSDNPYYFSVLEDIITNLIKLREARGSESMTSVYSNIIKNKLSN